jgi:hypothetical protein
MRSKVLYGGTQIRRPVLGKNRKMDNVPMLCRWIPFPHGMASPQDSDGGDGLQIWRVVANILKKQSRTASRGGPPAWGFGVGLTTPRRKKKACYEAPQEASGLDGFL